MNKFGFQWPEELDCAKFPETGTDICVGENNTANSNGAGGGSRTGGSIAHGDNYPLQPEMAGILVVI
jgi:frizzled protein 1/7